MSRLLRDIDYLRAIQNDSLSQIIESNQQTKLDVEQSAQSEMISYLIQRYITSQIFTDTKVFDITATYNGKQLLNGLHLLLVHLLFILQGNMFYKVDIFTSQ